MIYLKYRELGKYPINRISLARTSSSFIWNIVLKLVMKIDIITALASDLFSRAGQSTVKIIKDISNF
jgi:hypothetical protein